MMYLLRLAEAGRDAQRRKERRALGDRLRGCLPVASLRESPGRLIVETAVDAVAELARLHGVVSFSPCHACRLDELPGRVVALARTRLHSGATFRVRVRRCGTHAFGSQQLAAQLGHAIGAAIPGTRVDLRRAAVTIGVEICDDDCWLFDTVVAGIDHRPSPPCPPAEPLRFLVDQMLGRLRTWLRLVGFDAAGTHDESDGQVLARAADENRVVLTRDRALARVHGVSVHYVRAERTAEQLREVLAAFGLAVRREALLTRCTRCNVAVEPIAERDLPPSVPATVARQYAQFFRCPRCRRVYWPGSHVERILATIGDIHEACR
jgi:uncharacterized protein with PIN domain/tRNA(Ser,Leu) C12 N-acetylase TAN1